MNKTAIIVALVLFGVGLTATTIWYFTIYQPKKAKVILNSDGEPVGPGWIDFNDQG